MLRPSLIVFGLLCVGITPLAQEPSPRLNARLVAHRGFTRDYPENSMAALQAAAALGLAGAEIDLRTTKDRHIVLMHDPTVDRTTNGSGAVEGMTRAEIAALRLEQADGRVTDATIPDLDQVLAFLAAHPRFEVAFDAKSIDVAAVGRRIIAAALQDSVTFFIDDPLQVERARAIKRVDPRLRISVNLLTWWKIEGLPTFARRALDADALFASEYFFPQFGFREARQAGAEVQVFLPGVDNLQDRFRRVVMMGAELVSSDRPDLLVPLVVTDRR